MSGMLSLRTVIFLFKFFNCEMCDDKNILISDYVKSFIMLCLLNCVVSCWVNFTGYKFYLMLTCQSVWILYLKIVSPEPSNEPKTMMKISIAIRFDHMQHFIVY